MESVKKLNYEVLPSFGVPDEWRVEAIDFEGGGDCYITIFSGPLAEQRATAYQGWMNGASSPPQQ